MKPPPFAYEDPGDLGAALALLAEHGDEATVLAGGQSLMPLLNFRLARPTLLVDINNIGELAYVRGDGTGNLRIGALTRQAVLERSSMVEGGWPLLTEATRYIAHPQIRNRGTVGGSAAHADPAAELPVALAALNARFHALSTRGRRSIDWNEFFVTHFTTSLAEDELLVEIEVPPPRARAGSAFVEFARRRGDFALGGAAVLAAFDEGGACEHVAIALLGAAPRPVRAAAAEEQLLGLVLDADAAREAAARAVVGIEPAGDSHGSSAYRRSLIEAMVFRALVRATERAGSESR